MINRDFGWYLLLLNMSGRDINKMDELMKKSVEDIFNYMVIVEMDNRIERIRNRKEGEIL